MDRKFVSEEKKVVLVIDSCPAHPQIENLKSIKLFFLPLNTTSKVQPMDQGEICLLKTQYRKNLVSKIIQSTEKKKTLLKISFLLWMQMLVEAWDAVTTKLVQIVLESLKYWVSESQNVVIAEDDDHFKELEEEI